MVNQDNLENQDLQVVTEETEITAPKDLQVHQVPLVSKDLPVLSETLDGKAGKDQKVKLVLRELWESQELEGKLVCKVLSVFQVPLEKLESVVPEGSLAFRELLDNQETLEHLDVQVTQELMDLKEKSALLVQRASKDFLESKGQRVLGEILVSAALLDPMEGLDRVVQLDQLDNVEILAHQETKVYQGRVDR